MRNLFKAIFCFCILIFIQIKDANAQHISGSTLDTTTKIHQRIFKANIVKDTSEMIENRLVELALQHPDYDATEYQKNISQDELKKAQQSWLNLLSISANYNDQTFAKQPTNTTGTQYVYPKYFFGLTIPIGLFFSRSSDIKIAKDNYAINEDKQKALARTITKQVLTEYEQYKTYLDLMALENQVIDDEEAVFLQSEQKFKDGSITIESYNASAKNYNDELAKKVNLQLQETTVRLEVEEMIGMKLDDALKPFSRRAD